MNARWTWVPLVLLATLGACGGTHVPTPEPLPLTSLEFAASPGTTTEGELMEPVQVQVLVDGVLDVGTAHDVTLAFDAAAPGSTLQGTTTRATVGGVATFDDLSISGFGPGFTLQASSPGIGPVTDAPFDVLLAPPAKLVITSITPGPLTPFQAFDVTVEIRTAQDVLQTSATNDVTLSLSGGGPDLFWHASGTTPRVVELIDPAGGTVVRTLPTAASGEVDGAIWDPGIDLLCVTTTSGGIFIAEPSTGDEARWADANTLSGGLKSLVFDDAGVLHGGTGGTANHSTVDLVAGVNTVVGTYSMSVFTVTGTNGFARNPLTGVRYAVAKLSSGPRRLTLLDTATGVLTDIGSLGDNFAGITFDPAGTLFGVTGDGASVPETLYTIDPATAAKTLKMTLGNGGPGEVVVYVPRRLGGGLLTASAVSGVATFHDVYIDQPGTGYTVNATSEGLDPGSDSSVEVTGAAAPTASVGFASSASWVPENIPPGNAQVTLALTAPQAHAIPVFVTIDTDSTATAGGATPDTTKPRAFQVIIPPGATSASFDVPLVDDAIPEGDETVVLTIRSANLASGIGPISTHVLTIQSDE